MNRAQHRRMRRNIIDQDGCTRQRECACNDLYGKHPDDRQPDIRARNAVWWGRVAGHAAKERREGICKREEREEDAVGACGAEAVGERGVEEELEGDADDA